MRKIYTIPIFILYMITAWNGYSKSPEKIDEKKTIENNSSLTDSPSSQKTNQKPKNFPQATKKIQKKEEKFYTPPKIDREVPEYSTMLIKAFIIIGSMVLGLYLFSRYIITRKRNLLPKGPISVLANLPIGTNKGIYLIEIGNKGFLIGVGEDKITLIREFDEDELASIKEYMEEYTEERNDFISALKRAFKTPKKKEEKKELLFPQDNLDIIDSYRLRIRKLKDINSDEED